MSYVQDTVRVALSKGNSLVPRKKCVMLRLSDEEFARVERVANGLGIKTATCCQDILNAALCDVEVMLADNSAPAQEQA